MAAYTIGLDVGTQGVKAVVYDISTGAILGRGSTQCGLLPTEVKGRAEQDPAEWIQGSISAVKQATKDLDPASIVAIGVSGQQHGLVVLDAQKQVLRPAKLWCDTESSQEAEELSAQLGTTLVPSFTITKLLWLKRNEPEVFSQVAHVLLPHDYVNFWLTGKMVMESGDASGTGLLNVTTRTWNPAAINLIDPALKDWLPPLIGPNEVVGNLIQGAASALGLQTSVVVSPGSGDNAMSALGAGVVEAGQMVLSLGTSGTLFGKSEQPIVDPSGVICPFCDATGAGLPLLCTLNCTRLPQEVATAFGMSHEALTQLAAAEPAGCAGTSFLPYLMGERTPNWPHASGAILGLRPGCLRPGLLYRSALEGATFSLFAGAERMKAHGLRPSELRLVGGGAKNALWAQIVADVFQLPVRLPLEVESAALGAALQAAACATGAAVEEFVRKHPPAMSDKVVLPTNDPEVKALYQAAYTCHVELGQTLFANSKAR